MGSYSDFSKELSKVSDNGSLRIFQNEIIVAMSRA